MSRTQFSPADISCPSTNTPFDEIFCFGSELFDDENAIRSPSSIWHTAAPLDTIAQFDELPDTKPAVEEHSSGICSDIAINNHSSLLSFNDSVLWTLDLDGSVTSTTASPVSDECHI